MLTLQATVVMALVPIGGSGEEAAQGFGGGVAAR